MALSNTRLGGMRKQDEVQQATGSAQMANGFEQAKQRPTPAGSIASRSVHQGNRPRVMYTEQAALERTRQNNALAVARQALAEKNSEFAQKIRGRQMEITEKDAEFRHGSLQRAEDRAGTIQERNDTLWNDGREDREFAKKKQAWEVEDREYLTNGQGSSSAAAVLGLGRYGAGSKRSGTGSRSGVATNGAAAIRNMAQTSGALDGSQLSDEDGKDTPEALEFDAIAAQIARTNPGMGAQQVADEAAKLSGLRSMDESIAEFERGVMESHQDNVPGMQAGKFVGDDDALIAETKALAKERGYDFGKFSKEFRKLMEIKGYDDNDASEKDEKPQPVQRDEIERLSFGITEGDPMERDADLERLEQHIKNGTISDEQLSELSGPLKVDLNNVDPNDAMWVGNEKSLHRTASTKGEWKYASKMRSIVLAEMGGQESMITGGASIGGEKLNTRGGRVDFTAVARGMSTKSNKITAAEAESIYTSIAERVQRAHIVKNRIRDYRKNGSSAAVAQSNEINKQANLDKLTAQYLGESAPATAPASAPATKAASTPASAAKALATRKPSPRKKLKLTDSKRKDGKRHLTLSNL